MSTNPKPEFRPFHETIMEAIIIADEAGLYCLGRLLKVTKITSDHDKIIATWKEKWERVSGENDDLKVLASLRKQQKMAAEEKWEAHAREGIIS